VKVYLAGPYGSRDLLRTYADLVRETGCEVTSTWLNETHDITPGTEGAATELSDEVVLGHALMDLADIRKSDLVVLFTAAVVGVEGGGGRHIETGYALAQYIPIIVVGEPENVFHRMSDLVTICPTFGDTIAQLRALLAAEPLFDVRKCRICSCTDMNACLAGCMWIEDDLCSECIDGVGQVSA
jgi:nucleoside 2-deoxyribosyltransferase